MQLAELAREGLREFAGDYEFEQTFCSFLFMANAHTGDESMLRESVAVYERALGHEEDAKTQKSIKVRLSQTLVRLGEESRALELARSAENYDHRGVALFVSRGQERVKEALKTVYISVQMINQALSSLSDAEDENGLIFGDAEQLALCIKYLELYDFYRGTVLSWDVNSAVYRCVIASKYALAIGQRDNALALIERAVDYATGEYEPPGVGAFPGILFNDDTAFLTYSDKNGESYDIRQHDVDLRVFLCDYLLKRLHDAHTSVNLQSDEAAQSGCDSVSAALSGEPRFQAAVARAEEFARRVGEYELP